MRFLAIALIGLLLGTATAQTINTCRGSEGHLIFTDKPCAAGASASDRPPAVRNVPKSESGEGTNQPKPKRKARDVQPEEAIAKALNRAASDRHGGAGARDLAERCAHYRVESEVQSALVLAGGPAPTVKEHKERKKQVEARILAECN